MYIYIYVRIHICMYIYIYMFIYYLFVFCFSSLRRCTQHLQASRTASIVPIPSARACSRNGSRSDIWDNIRSSDPVPKSAGIRLRMQNGKNSRGIACLTPTVFFACFSLVDKLPDILVAGVRSLPCKYKEPLKRPELNILKKITLLGGRLHLFMFHPMFMCP